MTSQKPQRTIASGRAKRQRATRILFKRAAPLTGFASVKSNPAHSFHQKASGAPSNPIA